MCVLCICVCDSFSLFSPPPLLRSLPPSSRYVRREKEIAETRCGLAESKSLRHGQRACLAEQRLQEVEEELRETREAAMSQQETATQHAEILAKVCWWEEG